MERVNERLQQSGSGGLAWWRIRDSELAETAVGRSLRDAFRLQTLDARRHEMRLSGVRDALADAGIRPRLAKGWALADEYPAVGLRPYGDLDLFVAPDEEASARKVLAEAGGEDLRVDLHVGWPPHPEARRVVFDRARPVPLAEGSIDVFAPEDHLVFLATHLLFHGAWRPLWLCDIALVVERAQDDLDWAFLTELPDRRREEVRVAVRLAHEVLGADIRHTPWAGPSARLPAWLPRATRRAWSQEHYSRTTAFMLTETRLASLWSSLRIRWPNPIEVTHRWRAPYNGLPRAPLQALDVTARAGRALLDAPSKLALRRAGGDGP